MQMRAGSKSHPSAWESSARGTRDVPADDAARAARVFVNNRFGPETMTTIKARDLCVPSVANP